MLDPLWTAPLAEVLKLLWPESLLVQEVLDALEPHLVRVLKKREESQLAGGQFERLHPLAHQLPGWVAAHVEKQPVEHRFRCPLETPMDWGLPKP